MDKQQARKIVEETFEKPFNKNKFTNFIKNLLNSIEETPNTRYQGNYIPNAFKEHISILDRIGKYTDGKNEIDILAVTLRKETAIERARTMQRNFIAWYLNGSRGGKLKDAALVAFVSPDTKDWRFSLVKMEYKFDEKGKIKEELTPARRWSFLVGANEKSHTAQSRLWPLIINDESNPTLGQLEESFNIEKVTKEFFEKYRELFIRTKNHLDKVVVGSPKIKKDFNTKSVDTVNFAKKLLGQIIFLYFLQKKGWFGVERDAEWGTGSKQFLRELFEQKHGEYNNFFNDILEPLFYEALRIDRSHDDHYYSGFNCKIPFLNGGLFDPINNYDWVHTDVLIPNEMFSNAQKTKEGDTGDGVLDVFDRYNFTIKEDEPLEKEVAIDPELLGKAYEKFNAIRPDNFEDYSKALKSGKKGEESKFNRQFGVYYTPREIVHYMCQQSLINYLAAELEGKVEKADIETLIHHGEHVVENEAQVEKSGKETKTYYYRLPENIRTHADEIDTSLANIKVCDPAIGSGAFPVGMMSEIVRARNALSNYLKKNDRSIYHFKRECIENSLYGVDIDPGAVEIAKLRLWLSLVVDEEDIKQIKPLPNLDYKIMQGNSLLEEYEGIKLIDEDILLIDFRENERLTKEFKEEFQKTELEKIQLTRAGNIDHQKEYEIDSKLKKLLKLINKLENNKQDPNNKVKLLDMEELLHTAKLAEELKDLHAHFFNTTNVNQKNELRRKIDEIEYRLIETSLKEQGKEKDLVKLNELKRLNAKPFFLWKLHFFEVFKEKGGFDVVIGNPPYGVSIRDNYRKAVLETLGKVPDFEIFYYFIEKAFNLLSKNGIKTFIIPNTILFNTFAKTYRKSLLEKWDLLEIIDCSDIIIFENTTVRNIITLFRKSTLLDIVGYRNTSNIKSFQDLLCKKYETIPKKELLLNNQNWSLSFKIDKEILNITCRIKKICKPLIKYFPNLSQGLIAYDKYQGQTQRTIKNRIFHSFDKVNTNYKPWLWGEDVTRYSIKWNGKEYINYCDKIANPRKPIYFIEPRVLVREITNPLIYAGFTSEELYNDPSIIIILKGNIIHLYCILAILNSKMASFYHFNNAPKAIKGVFPKILVEDIKQFPINSELENISIQNGFISLVNKILLITQSPDYPANKSKQAKVKEYEKAIDLLVYKLYELTYKEVKIVDPEFGLSKAEYEREQYGSNPAKEKTKLAEGEE